MTYSGFIWWYVLEKTAGDLMEGGKPPRDCKQSLRPYNEFECFRRGVQCTPAVVAKTVRFWDAEDVIPYNRF